jgi:hypothetical protein
MDERFLICSYRYALRDPVYTVYSNILNLMKYKNLLVNLRLHDSYGDAGVHVLHHQCWYISELTLTS